MATKEIGAKPVKAKPVKPVKAAEAAAKPIMSDPKGQTLVCLRTLTEPNPASLAAYEKLGGYAQLKIGRAHV